MLDEIKIYFITLFILRDNSVSSFIFSMKFEMKQYFQNILKSLLSDHSKKANKITIVS